MENKLITSIILIFTTLFGVGIGELLDEKVHIPILEIPQEIFDEAENFKETENQCNPIIIAYMSNGDKYYGKCSGLGSSCKLTKSEEILTELG